MNENILRLILPSLKAQKNSPRTDCGDDASLIIPLALLIMFDSRDFFLALALLYIIGS